MKKILLTLLAVVVVLGLFAATGYAGYRMGFAQGAQMTADGDTWRPGVRPFHGMGPGRMPMHSFGMERGFPRGFGMGGFSMLGFGFFSPLMPLARLAVIALILWFAYWLFTRSGWQLTRTGQTNETQSAKTEAQG